MQKRPGAVKFKGILSPARPRLKAGDKAPDFKCADSRPRPSDCRHAGQGAGCSWSRARHARLQHPDPQVRQGTGGLGDKVASYTISSTCRSRRSDSATIRRTDQVDEDAVGHPQSFVGHNYGVELEGLAVPLLTRSVFVVDKSGTITYVEYVAEVTSEPNYDAALAALKTAAG